MKREFASDDFAKLFVYMQKEFKNVNGRIDELQGDIHNVKTTLDDMLSEYRILSDEHDAEAGAHIRIDDTLSNHETRIEQLESLELNQQVA